MKGIKHWLKNNYRSYCALATMAMDCGLVEQPNQGF